MLSIDSWQGTAAELAEFVGHVWEESYAGKMPFPRWTHEYFRWHLRLEEKDNGENLLAAREDSQLVGVLLGARYQFRSSAGIHPGVFWSCLSVHPDYRGRGIAKALDAERCRRMRIAGQTPGVSYRFAGSRHSLAKRPVRNSPGEPPSRKVSCDVRILNAARFRKWRSSRFQGMFSQLAGLTSWVRPPRGGGSGIRCFSIEDLGSCASLLNSAYAACELAIHWDRATLQHQLCGSPLSQTLILEDRGTILGLVNFHALPIQDRCVEHIGVFDLIAFGNVSTNDRVRLINAALRQMAEQGMVLAIKLRCGDAALWPLIRCRFLLQPARSCMVLEWAGEQVSISARARMHLLWR